MDNVNVKGIILDETEKAVRFTIFLGRTKRNIWFPKSVISFYQSIHLKEYYEIVIPKWLAKSKGLY